MCACETGMYKVRVCVCLLQVAGQSVPAVHRHLHLPPALQAAHQVRSLQVACWSSPQLTNTEHNLKQNEAQWLWRINRQISTQKTSPTVTLTWHANKYTVHKLHQRCILVIGCPPPPMACTYIGIPSISGPLSDTGVYKHKAVPIFI